MAEPKALRTVFENADTMFFEHHPERQARIRLPFKGESDGEFWQMGTHNRTQRRILLWRVPRDNPFYEKLKQPLLKIPFLTFFGELVEDTDDVLLPIIATIMQEQAAVQGA